MVKVLPAQRSVAVCRLHLEYPTMDLQDRDVEGATAKVEDRNGLPFLGLHAESKRRRRGLVDYSLHVEACNLPSIFGSLTL
mmetsp:Transcript_76651/g.192883  ORF Transcript_76651/g.192883 Transcript_76651/m.192883 type:complete len:81 (+) Transcript_76651:142-384(+)